MDHIYSVSEITRNIKTILEGRFPDFFLEAEISEFRRHGSGHIYFTLKDSEALIPSVMWRSAAQSLTVSPRVGDRVLCRGSISVYPPQGKYQFIAKTLRPAGTGDLFLAFEALKEKLRSEGLFDPARRAAIPAYPLHTAIISSPSGAALQDMLRVFRQDAPHIRISVYPARVQGEGSARQMIQQMQQIIASADPPDLLILGRGGGSLEDLWEFNSEDLARQIAACPIPVISAVGHETDFSISDFVADHRASTPTAAAELCVRSWKEVPDILNYSESRFYDALLRVMDRSRRDLDSLMQRHGFRKHSDLLKQQHLQIDTLKQRLKRAADQQLHNTDRQLNAILENIRILSPNRTLARGFAINRDSEGRIIRRAEQLAPGQNLVSEYPDGFVHSTVDRTEAKSDHETA